ncbi:glycosyltransferase [Piscinibacter koreensis]|uniref:Glycosyltransferase n=1 Tax=Piscinibacter koreensis TaxID=2742824 RepID=A0A7Y6NPT0_9BURK|nr:glycosyltransferase [Schlegelella koreensis]NUZ06989.1 glycosyltransferase [Schlegelella koreensis]
MSRAAGAAPRVLLIADRLDVAGGVERFVSRLADALHGEGLAVALGSVDTTRERLAFPVGAGVPVVVARRLPRLPAGVAEPALGAWGILRRQWRIGRALGRLIRRERPDVVVLNGLVTALSVLALSPRVAPRAICCDHNHFDARSRPWRALRRRLYPRVGAVVSLTEADAARFRTLNRHVRVIPNVSTLRADAPALPTAPLVLAIGRHVAQKGLDLLLHAWVDVAAAIQDATLRIVGSGPLERELHALADRLGIGASVEWVAHSDDVAAELRAAAVFVLPSRYEGMPLALLEAQALGVPAVAFDCPTGPREIVAPETGIVVAPGDTRALGAAVIRLLRDPALRASMAHAAIARSHAHFDEAAQGRRWAELVREVAARGARDGG